MVQQALSTAVKMSVCQADGCTFSSAFSRPELLFPLPAVRLNDPGVRNGVIQVEVDGETKIIYNKVLYRWATWHMPRRRLHDPWITLMSP
jgi:hypothetical protein